MSKAIYVGIGGTARKVPKLYVGVNGVARRVKKGYVGVNGVARLFYSYLGSLPSGYTRLQYIKSTGEQYLVIDSTTLYPGTHYSFIKMTACVEKNQYGGAIISGHADGFSIQIRADPAGYYILGQKTSGVGTNNNWNSSKLVPYYGYGEKLNFTAEFYGISSATLTIDNGGANDPETVLVSPCYGSCNMLFTNTPSDETHYISAELYSLDFLDENNDIVRSYIPCKNPSGTVGLYEVIKKQFYSSQTDIPLLAGPAM